MLGYDSDDKVQG
jgi:hypothetical protein